jgi:hypothetical protein
MMSTVKGTTCTKCKQIGHNRRSCIVTDVQEIIQEIASKIERTDTKSVQNRGTGAGGANTNLYGKKFEQQTSHYTKLLEMGYEKYSDKKNPKKDTDFYLSKTYPDKTIVFASQNGFKTYMKNRYNVHLYRCPDEAYIIEYPDGKKVIKILEKKEQHVEGSVETKLWASIGLKEEYQFELDGFEIDYGFCVNEYLKKKLLSTEKKYITLNKIFAKHHIQVMFGEDEDYSSNLDDWIYS